MYLKFRIVPSGMMAPLKVAPFHIAEQGTTLFGAENQVDDEVGQRLRHGSGALTGLEIGWRG